VIRAAAAPDGEIGATFPRRALKLRDDCPPETIEQRANEGYKQAEQALQA
jgi:hypothetical protein